jgi:hypothetical protein
VTGESLGLLIEEQRTNRLTYSEQFDDVVWSKTRTSITPNTVIAPDGTLTGDTYIGNGVSGSKTIVQTDTTSATGKTLSVYAKRETNDFIQLLFGADTGPWANFDLLNGTVGSTGTVLSATITPVGNGWFRCSVSTASTTATSATINLVSTSTAARNEANTLTTGVYLWGAQLEAGAFPTSYIATVASQVTRSADAASMTGANFSSWYNAAEGTLYADVSFYQRSTFAFAASLNDGTANNEIVLRSASNGGSVAFRVANAGVEQASTAVTTTTNQPYKAAGAYAVNSFQVAVNGTPGTEDTSGTIPVVNQLVIGARILSGSTLPLNGTIRKLSYYPKRLANAELQALTQN